MNILVKWVAQTVHQVARQAFLFRFLLVAHTVAQALVSSKTFARLVWHVERKGARGAVEELGREVRGRVPPATPAKASLFVQLFVDELKGDLGLKKPPCNDSTRKRT